MARLGFIFLALAIIVPLLLTKICNVDKWHSEMALFMYIFAILGAGMLALSTQ